MFVIWVWQIAAMVIAVRQVLDYSTTGKAIVVVLIGFAINIVVSCPPPCADPRHAYADALKGNRTPRPVSISGKRPLEETLNAGC